MLRYEFRDDTSQKGLAAITVVAAHPGDIYVNFADLFRKNGFPASVHFGHYLPDKTAGDFDSKLVCSCHGF